MKVVLGFEPSALFEKVILAPGIGTPRALLIAGEEGLELGVSGLFGCVVVSVFGILGILIFGILNWAAAGTATKAAEAIAVISITDNLRIIFSPVRLRFGSRVKGSIGDKVYTIATSL